MISVTVPVIAPLHVLVVEAEEAASEVVSEEAVLEAVPEVVSEEVLEEDFLEGVAVDMLRRICGGGFLEAVRSGLEADMWMRMCGGGLLEEDMLRKICGGVFLAAVRSGLEAVSVEEVSEAVPRREDLLTASFYVQTWLSTSIKC